MKNVFLYSLWLLLLLENNHDVFFLPMESRRKNQCWLSRIRCQCSRRCFCPTLRSDWRCWFHCSCRCLLMWFFGCLIVSLPPIDDTVVRVMGLGASSETKLKRVRLLKKLISRGFWRLSNTLKLGYEFTGLPLMTTLMPLTWTTSGSTFTFSIVAFCWCFTFVRILTFPSFVTVALKLRN